MTTDIEQFLDRVAQRMEANGFTVQREVYQGRPAVVGRQAKFKLRWFATRMTTFVMVAPVPHDEANQVGLDRLLDQSVDYTIAHKGKIVRGLQAGVAAVTVAVIDEPSREAVEWASKPHGRRWAAIAYPVLADLSQPRTVLPRRMWIGVIYVPYFKRTVRAVIDAAFADSNDSA